MAEFVELHASRASASIGPETENSWNLSLAEVLEAGGSYDLSVKNPNKKEEAPLRSPQVILTEMKNLDIESEHILQSIADLI